MNVKESASIGVLLGVVEYRQFLWKLIVSPERPLKSNRMSFMILKYLNPPHSDEKQIVTVLEVAHSFKSAKRNTF